MNATATASVYTAAKVKSFVGMEGYGFNADLLRNGKKVAFVVDEGNGGCYHYDFISAAEAEAFDAHVLANAKAEDGDSTLDPRVLLSCNRDCLMGALVDDVETEKRIRAGFKRHLKRGILFLLDGRPMQTKGKIVAVNQAHIDALRSRHPTAQILNALPEAEALDLYRAHFVEIR